MQLNFDISFNIATQKQNNQQSSANDDRYNKYNNSEGNHSSFDQTQIIAESDQLLDGFKIFRDPDQVTTKNSDDYNGIAQWLKDTDTYYNSAEKDLRNQVNDYGIAMNKYIAAMSAWQEAHKLDPNAKAISSSQVVQGLALNREPDAHMAISTNLQQAAMNPKLHGFPEIGIDSQSAAHVFIPVNNNQNVTVTYDNLKNSSYIDGNGNTHKIAKIVRTFSDIHWSDQVKRGSGANLHELQLFSDPTDGFWYYGISDLVASDQYYDDHGNIINFDKDTAYMGVTSLNAAYDNNGNVGKTGSARHVEKVQGLTNTTAYALQGSSVVNHDGTLYADETNIAFDNKSWTTWNGPEEWDHRGGKYEYYGTGLLSFHGNSVSLKFETTHNGYDDQNGTWATMTTNIPATPGPKAPAPKEWHYHYNKLVVNKLPHKTSETHYHYDVVLKRQTSELSVR